MLPVATSLRIIKTPWATYTIVAANVLINFLVTWHTNLIIPDRVAHKFGFNPASFGNLSAVPTLVTSMFLHGDLLHLIGKYGISLGLRKASGKSAAENQLPGFLFNGGDHRRTGSHAHGTRLLRTPYRCQWSHQRCLGSVLHL